MISQLAPSQRGDCPVTCTRFGGAWQVAASHLLSVELPSGVPRLMDRSAVINLTPHPVTLLTTKGELEISPARASARVKIRRVALPPLTVAEREINVVGTFAEACSDHPLPDAQPGVWLIVSRAVAEVHKGRQDLLVPHDLERAADGSVLGCRSLASLASVSPDHVERLHR